MGQGRKAIPDEIKRLRGTLRKDRVNKNQPKIGGIALRFNFDTIPLVVF
jgi:hypothetical protein